MSKANPLSGLLAHYGDSDDDSEDEGPRSSKMRSDLYSKEAGGAPEEAATEPAAATVHPAPVPHCPWSACYDEASGYTYYWNQFTNAVTWEAPPEYLLALKLAQQQLTVTGSAEVSAEEWQLYQQALADKQKTQATASTIAKPPAISNSSKTMANNAKNTKKQAVNGKPGKRKPPFDSDSEDEKIELITSYYHSDSDSNDETTSPVKKTPAPAAAPISKPTSKPKPQPDTPRPAKNPFKKQRTKPVEYGPPLPPNQDYKVPIGPELPPELVVEVKPKSPEKKEVVEVLVPQKSPEIEQRKSPTLSIDNDDDDELLKKLKDKAKLLEKLGGELPSELQQIIKDEKSSGTASPVIKNIDENSNNSKSTIDTNIDDLLEEIEKKEMPKISKAKVKIDIFDDDTKVDEKLEKGLDSGKSTPKELSRSSTPSRDEEIKPLFPSSQAITEKPPKTLFPSSANIEETPVELGSPKPEIAPEIVAEKKGANIYLMGTDEAIEKPGRKKLRISNSVLPERKKIEVPSYTTKYSQVIDGFAGERTGLGFSQNDGESTEPKKAVAYGGMMFTKGEVLNEDKKDEEMEDLIELLDAKLKFLNQQQPYAVTPVQEMTIQMQTLVAAHLQQSISPGYLRRWLAAAAASLARLEAAAAPPGWTCRFHRYAVLVLYQHCGENRVGSWENWVRFSENRCEVAN
ncbi:nucleolar protein dao-5 isoform X2 [Plutella xylostella]|uniref:nucleolar protein dao-5 isoform X2 n=1 Tax=Plutella xylostella TaxID=51655 RepID=UPI0020327123|nr:nucleolar protein dao-5 isoform X2 [Plutella xylostella]